MKKLFILLLFVLGCGKPAIAPTPPVEGESRITYADPETVDPALPNVLLIGDSISDGYTLKVRALLQGQANVYRAYENCQHTKYGLEKLDAWIGGRHFDVIHFNFGLWDLAHKRYDLPEQNTPGKGPPSDSIGGFVGVSPWQYEANLKQLVTRMKATGAKLIFATTTPIPPTGSGGRWAKSEELYNQFAVDVMTAETVDVDDLWTQFKPVSENYRASPGNIHFNDAGYDILAGFVTTSIQSAL